MPYLFPNYMPAAVAWPAVSQQESPWGFLIVDAWSFLDLKQPDSLLTHSSSSQVTAKYFHHGLDIDWTRAHTVGLYFLKRLSINGLLVL